MSHLSIDVAYYGYIVWKLAMIAMMMLNTSEPMLVHSLVTTMFTWVPLSISIGNVELEKKYNVVIVYMNKL